MNIFAQFKRDNDRIVSGAPFEIEKGVVIMVARMHESNPAFKKLAQQYMTEKQASLDAIKDVTERTEATAKLSEDAFAQTCIKSWTGIEDANGLIECTPENIERLRKEVPELWDSIMRFGMNPANYLGSFDEEESLKNSQTASVSA